MLPRADRYAIAALVLLTVGSWASRVSGPIDLRWDAAVYYILGTSLAEGKGYRLLNEPGEIQAILFPPLLPAIIAVHQHAIGSTDPVLVGTSLRALFFVLFAAFVLASYVLLRQAARAPYAFGGTLVCSLTFLPIWLSDRCYTDLPFALAAVLFAIGRPRDGTAGRELLSWAAATAAFLLRTIGGAFFVAWIAEAIVHRNYRRAGIRILLALLPIMGWQLYVYHVTASAEYLAPSYAYQRADYNIYNVTYGRLFSLRDHLNPAAGTATLSERVQRLPGMLPAVVTGLGGAISAPLEDWRRAVDEMKRRPVLRLVPWRTIDIALALLGGVVLAALAIQLKAGYLRIPLSALVYVAGLCSMPPSYFNELPRYLSAIGPLLMMAVLQGSTLSRLRGLPGSLGAAGMVLITASVAVVLSVGTFGVARGYSEDLHDVEHRDWNGKHVEYRLFSYEEDYAALDRGLEWLKEHASPGDVVASTTPHWVYLRTGLKAVMPPFEDDGARARALLDSVPVRYVIVSDWLSRRHALPAVQHAAGAWRSIYWTPHCIIYERAE